MKRQLKEILEKILAEAVKQNRLSEQIIKNQALLGCQNQRIHKTILSWWGTDLDHHSEENNLIKKIFNKNPEKIIKKLFEADPNSGIKRTC